MTGLRRGRSGSDWLRLAEGRAGRPSGHHGRILGRRAGRMCDRAMMARFVARLGRTATIERGLLSKVASARGVGHVQIDGEARGLAVASTRARSTNAAARSSSPSLPRFGNRGRPRSVIPSPLTDQCGAEGLGCLYAGSSRLLKVRPTEDRRGRAGRPIRSAGAAAAPEASWQTAPRTRGRSGRGRRLRRSAA